MDDRRRLNAIERTPLPVTPMSGATVATNAVALDPLPAANTTARDPVPMLLDIAQVVAGPLDLRASLHRVVEALTRDLGALRTEVSLLGSDGQEIRVEASHGADDIITDQAGTHVVATEPRRYRLGQGITGRVVATGKPIVVPHVSREPMLFDGARLMQRGHALEESSLLVVPIAIEAHTVGALSVQLAHAPGNDLPALVRLLRLVAVTVGQGMRVHRLLDTDRRRAQQIDDADEDAADSGRIARSERQEGYDYSSIVGSSAPMRQLYEQISQVARTTTTALIRGESGTGKELVAHAIHRNSPRAKGPFIKVSCAALPETLVESELFGHERGAFTGAVGRKKGRFELAEGGTLFLDEIGELSLTTQVKLLRVLQEREIERLGGTETIKVDVRVVAATNKDMERAIAEGEFREDLYYRLDVFTIWMPPLRERNADITLLADYFLTKYAAAHDKRVRRISASALDLLANWSWPGNVRELENTIERAVLVCDGPSVQPRHLPPALQTVNLANEPTKSVVQPLEDAVSAFERSLIENAVRATRGNRAQAARMLQTTDRILGYKMTKYGLDLLKFRG